MNLFRLDATNAVGDRRRSASNRGEASDYASTLAFAPRGWARGHCDAEPIVIGPARAELRGAATTLAAQPAPSSATPAASHSAACTVTTDQVRFDFPLPRTARLLVSGLPIKVVALGSSSTRGAGASTPAACYPSRLAEELVRRFPGHKFTVLNRGVNGEDVSNMLARLDTAV